MFGCFEPTDRARFLEEPRERARALVGRGVQRLDRDRRAQLAVLAAIDHAHAAGADPVEDAVVPEHQPVQPPDCEPASPGIR